VLVVDDDSKFASVIVRCLVRAGYRCSEVPSGEKGLVAVWTDHPDLIVLDIMLPGLSGIEVCRRLRASGWIGFIVLVSARSSSADRSDAIVAGADAFLAKPFPLNDLVAIVNGFVAPTFT
jgi:two-component system response regulator MprA